MVTINNVVLGTVHMYYNKIPKPDILEIMETSFEENEIFDALKELHQAVVWDAPQGRQTSPNRTAIHAYAMDLYDSLSKLVSEGKLPVIVVSSDQLARVPLNKKKMDNSEVATVNCRLEALETMIKTVVTTVNKLGDKPSFTGTIPKVQVGGGQPGWGSGVVAGGAGGWPHLGGQGQGVGRAARDKSPSVKRTFNDVARENLENAGVPPEAPYQNVLNRRRQPRKMTYGTNKVGIEDGAEAAPIDVFIGNTNPRASEEIIKRVLLKCAGNMPEKPNLEILDVKLLTNPERDPNPRFKSWIVTVPYACRTLMEDDDLP